MKKAFVLVLCLWLCGCATFGQMERGLNSLQGQNIQTAFDVLGYPSGKQEFGSDMVYYWQVNSTGAVLLPQTSTTSGYVGMTPIHGLQKTRLNVPQKCHWVKLDPIEEIQERIKEKEKKLQDYHNRYEQCCLLITANRYRGSQAFECTQKLINSCFMTDFDRIFFFDCFTKAALEFKNKHRRVNRQNLT